MRRPLDPSVDLAAYRILEEALSNVRKHAPGAGVRIRLAYTDSALRLEVVDTGGGEVWPPQPAAEGSGLLGMRERALLVGGSLEAGPADGGFALTAELPLAAALRDASAAAGSAPDVAPEVAG